MLDCVFIPRFIMTLRYTFIMILALLSSPVWAEDRADMISDELNFDAPFDQAAVRSALRSLFNQALDVIEDHLEFDMKAERNQETHEEHGRLQLKIYPKGKSQSDAHISGELQFRSSPEERDFSFDLKLPKESNSISSSSSDSTI